MKKRLFAFIAGSLLAFSLIGCSNEGKTPANPSDSRTENTASVTEATETTAQAPVVETTEYVPEYLYVQLTDANDFSEGIAWVKFEDPLNDGKKTLGLLHAEDMVICTSDGLSQFGSFGSDFSGGYSYINKEKSSFYIFDESGNITAQSPDDGTSYTIVDGGDGVYLVYQQIRSLDVSEDRYGFITGEGEWLVELTAECPLSLTYEDGGVTYHYLGEHTFLAYQESLYVEDYWCFYNVDTGSFKSYTTQTGIHMYDDHGDLYTAYHGLIPFYSHINKFLMVFNIQENDCENYGWTDFELLYYHDGILFESEAYDGGTVTDGAFYTLDNGGELLLEYTKYPLYVNGTPGFYEFNDGAAAVIVKGADKEHYLSFIDLNGEFLFEPVKMQVFNGYLHYSACGDQTVYASIYDYDGEPVDAIIRSDGTIVEAAKYLDSRSAYNNAKPYYTVTFSEGYAWSSERNCFITVQDGTILEMTPRIRNPLAGQ